jgi:hypothetical protein
MWKLDSLVDGMELGQLEGPVRWKIGEFVEGLGLYDLAP